MSGKLQFEKEFLLSMKRNYTQKKFISIDWKNTVVLNETTVLVFIRKRLPISEIKFDQYVDDRKNNDYI